MKKHLFFGMFAAVGMTLATSCTNDENVIPSSNEAQVTFSLGLESGINTRAISDGTGINQLFYAIFDSEGKCVISKTNQVDFEKEVGTNISLVKGETYTAVFWAWDKDCEAYTIENEKTVKIDYSQIPNNDEDSDAFFKNVTFTVDGNENISIVLKRAFAQLNVGITAEEWETATKQGVGITKSTVTIKQAATTLNLLDGTVDGATDITLKADAIPTEKLYVDADCNGEDEEYVYLSMSYFLANDGTDGASKTTVDNLAFTFSDDNGTSFVLTDGLANAPVQRNHRTNIISFGGIGGGIITGDVTVKVLLDPLYDGEHTLTNENIWEENAGIYTEEALAGKTIEIPAGWHIRNGWILEPMPENWSTDKPNGIDDTYVIYRKSYSIDGKGNTVTFEPYAYKFAAKNVFAAADNAIVTVKDLNFAGEHSGVYAGVYVRSYNKYTTKFENVNIVNNKLFAYNNNGQTPIIAFTNYGTTELKNCTITGSDWVGENKDGRTDLAKFAIEKYDGIYDVFAPNTTTTKIDNSTIGRIYVNAQGILEVYNGSKVNEIICDPIDGLAKAKITIDAEVGNLKLLQYSPTNYPYTLTIKANAKIGTLNLNSKENHTFNKNNVIIEEGANITTIICNGTEYTSIADFKAAI